MKEDGLEERRHEIEREPETEREREREAETKEQDRKKDMPKESKWEKVGLGFTVFFSARLPPEKISNPKYNYDKKIP